MGKLRAELALFPVLLALMDNQLRANQRAGKNSNNYEGQYSDVDFLKIAWAIRHKADFFTSYKCHHVSLCMP